MNNSNPKSDTYASTRSAIARLILSSPLASRIGYPDAPANKGALHALQSIVDGTARDNTWSFVSVDFRRAGTTVSLDVQLDIEYDGEKGYLQDESGNDYVAYNLKCTVNWPTHGTIDPATALARLELYREAAMLAAAIHAQFAGTRVWKLVRSKEERERATVACEV